jgi:RNA polymerase sigma-70 factor, ECF subfamily
MSGDPGRSDEHAALLRAVHDEHSQALMRYVIRLTNGDMQFAEDVVQESLLRLSRSPRCWSNHPSRRGHGYSPWRETW